MIDFEPIFRPVYVLLGASTFTEGGFPFNLLTIRQLSHQVSHPFRLVAFSNNDEEFITIAKAQELGIPLLQVFRTDQLSVEQFTDQLSACSIVYGQLPHGLNAPLRQPNSVAELVTVLEYFSSSVFNVFSPEAYLELLANRNNHGSQVH
jgi:hypothetical protein